MRRVFFGALNACVLEDALAVTQWAHLTGGKCFHESVIYEGKPIRCSVSMT